MRQLDLFGSFSGTVSEQDNAEKQVVDSKKQEEKAEKMQATYSKASPRPHRTTLPQNGTPAATSDIDSGSNDNSTSSSRGSTAEPTLFSAFNAPLEETVANAQEVEAIREVEVIITETSEAEIAVDDEQEDKLPLFTEESPELNTSINADEIVVQSAEEVSEPAVKTIKKVTAKTTKQNAPELERNGSVIFDDGKISVKIKNKSPFPAPIVKVIKEKVIREPQKRGRKSFKEIDAEIDLIEIPEDDVLYQKQYYPISEVAKWFRVNTSLLRFWENEFDVLKPRKNRKGDRMFRPEDVKNLQLIYHLLRQRKYTIEGAKEYIKTNKKKADIQLQLTNTLQKFKGFLLDMKANLES